MKLARKWTTSYLAKTGRLLVHVYDPYLLKQFMLSNFSLLSL